MDFNDPDFKKKLLHHIEVENGTSVEVKQIRETLKSIDNKFESIEKKFDNYVSKERFEPVKIVVYGLIGIILTSVLVTLLVKTLGLTLGG